MVKHCPFICPVLVISAFIIFLTGDKKAFYFDYQSHSGNIHVLHNLPL